MGKKKINKTKVSSIYLLSSSNPFPCHEKYSPVEEQNCQQWNIKARSCSENLIANILRNQAFVILQSFIPFGIFPSKHWCNGYKERENPQDHDHDSYSFSCSLMGIIDIRDGPIPISFKNYGNELFHYNLHYNQIFI